MNSEIASIHPSSSRFSGKQVLLFGGLAVLATAIVTTWWINQYLYAATFEPTRLTESGQMTLDQKLSHLDLKGDPRSSSGRHNPQPTEGGLLEPEPYSEEGASREILLTEREVNAMIAQDSEIAKHLAINLADNLVSVKLVVPVNDDVPVVGGKTLKLNFGVELSYANGKPVVVMQGISLGGVPVPSAWWGDIKDLNLVEEFGEAGGFWDQFAKGVEDLHIQNGQLRLLLKE